MSEICIRVHTFKKDKRTPNDQRSDSMNPNNPMSREYVAKLQRLTEQANKLEVRFKAFDRLSLRFDRLERQLDLETRFREKRLR